MGKTPLSGHRPKRLGRDDVNGAVDLCYLHREFAPAVQVRAGRWLDSEWRSAPPTMLRSGSLAGHQPGVSRRGADQATARADCPGRCHFPVGAPRATALRRGVVARLPRVRPAACPRPSPLASGCRRTTIPTRSATRTSPNLEFSTESREAGPSGRQSGHAGSDTV